MSNIRVAAIFYILLHGEADEIAYNISSENAIVSIKQFAETIIEAFPDRNLAVEFRIPEKKTYDGTAPFTMGTLSSGKLSRLGWKPRVSLQEGIRRTISYLESEGSEE